MSMHTNKKQKAQMEIMGLVIIIILATLAMLFVIQFIILKEPSEIKRSYSHSKLATNTVNAMLITTTGCKKQKLTQLLQDCASDKTIICENRQGSCQYAADTIKTILDQTLVEWNKQFEFTAKIQELNIINPIKHGECLEREAEPYYIQTAAGIMTLRLDVCS